MSAKRRMFSFNFSRISRVLAFFTTRANPSMKMANKLGIKYSPGEARHQGRTTLFGHCQPAHNSLQSSRGYVIPARVYHVGPLSADDTTDHPERPCHRLFGCPRSNNTSPCPFLLARNISLNTKMWSTVDRPTRKPACSSTKMFLSSHHRLIRAFSTVV